MSDTTAFVVGSEDAAERLDVAVARYVAGVTRSAARHLVDEGHVTLNGRTGKPAARVREGDRVEVRVVRPPLRAEPEAMDLDVVYRDADLAVIDKPAGLVVHPAAGHRHGTLANALAAHFPSVQGVGDEMRPGIVHRLDKDTSGLMVVALRHEAMLSLQRQIAEHTAQRTYLALIAGRVAHEAGVIDAPVGRDRNNRKRMATHGLASRQARTAYRVREHLDGFTLVEATLQTGRTHQIRVHFSALGHPLAGDATYGGPPVPGLRRQFLHAFALSFDSPSTGRRLSFRSDLPDDLAQVLQRLRAGRRSDR